MLRRDLSTADNRSFWAFVDRTAAQVRRKRRRLVPSDAVGPATAMIDYLEREREEGEVHRGEL